MLIMKGTHKGIAPSNYCPTWKLLSDTTVLKLKGHVCQYASKAQQGIGNNSRCPKHQLLKTGLSLYDCKLKQTNPSSLD
ncbi:hypothetical protein VZT92_000719 [Zoarces viviparus]|uniref:Uncharacterized protein n=1 Tax=Zoarces viviparus TaxID=48416 RepID=A0AAW1G7T9_ZOAVI